MQDKAVEQDGVADNEMASSKDNRKNRKTESKTQGIIRRRQTPANLLELRVKA